MSSPQKPAFDPMLARPAQPIRTNPATPRECEVKVQCDRCGGDVYRMHAVWRCVKCGFKSDCCGW